jgi:hypothetical protein
LCLVSWLNIDFNHFKLGLLLVQPVSEDAKKQACSLGLKSLTYELSIRPDFAI